MPGQLKYQQKIRVRGDDRKRRRSYGRTRGRGFEVRPEPDIAAKANFEAKRPRGINRLLVSFDSEIRLEPDIEIMRISESGH
jgi:hypothetical protein